MNAPPLPAALPGAGRLHARRCIRHSGREAAARCPGCGEFFCRECVVEHDGRLLCSACVARVAATRGRQQRRWTAIRQGATLAGAAGLLWLIFFSAGTLLTKIPPDFHDGTIWKKQLDRAAQ